MQKFTKFQLISTLPQVSLSELLIGQKCVILTKSVKLTKIFKLAKFNPHPKIDRNRDNFDLLPIFTRQFPATDQIYYNSIIRNS